MEFSSGAVCLARAIWSLFIFSCSLHLGGAHGIPKIFRLLPVPPLELQKSKQIKHSGMAQVEEIQIIVKLLFSPLLKGEKKHLTVLVGVIDKCTLVPHDSGAGVLLKSGGSC